MQEARYVLPLWKSEALSWSFLNQFRWESNLFVSILDEGLATLVIYPENGKSFGRVHLGRK